MINLSRINQIANNYPKNSRLPSNPNIHLIACNENAIKLLSFSMDSKNHIVFHVIQPEQVGFLSDTLFQTVHCIIVKDTGVLLSSNCSQNTEKIIEKFAKWVPYLKIKEPVHFYDRSNLTLVTPEHFLQVKG
jgi:hypothetical protein